MNTAPAELLEALARLDNQFGDSVRMIFDDEAARAMTDEQLLAFTRVTESLGRHADAARVAAAGEIDDRSRSDLGPESLAARTGATNAIELLCRLTSIAGVTARARIRHAHATGTRTTLLGDTLPASFPAIRRALADGAIGIDSITAITGELGPVAARTTPSRVEAAEHELVAAATGTSADGAPACSADDTRTQAKVWRLVLDPDGTLPDYERALRQRGLRLGRQTGDLVPVHGTLLADVAAQFQRLIDAHLNPRVEDRTDDPGVTFREIPHDNPDSPLTDTRTREQKVHDVFATILGVAARSAETPTLGGLPPTLLVTIAADELHRDNGIGFIDGTDGTVPAFVARQVACCGGIQRLVFGDDGHIIELGSPNRTFTGQQRRAITARDGECIIPGCHIPAAWCEIHHVIPHADGGPTHTDNGVPLCWWHHRMLDISGWEIRIVNGVPEVRAPASIDPTRPWRPAAGSLHRARNRRRQQFASQTAPAPRSRTG